MVRHGTQHKWQAIHGGAKPQHKEYSVPTCKGVRRLTFKLAVRHSALLQTAAAPDRLKGLPRLSHCVSLHEFLYSSAKLHIKLEEEQRTAQSSGCWSINTERHELIDSYICLPETIQTSSLLPALLACACVPRLVKQCRDQSVWKSDRDASFSRPGWHSAVVGC